MKILRNILIVISASIAGFLFVGINITIFFLGAMLFGTGKGWLLAVIFYGIIIAIVSVIVHLETKP